MFFCAQEDNSQYIGLWWQALNSGSLKAADVCLDYNYGLSTIPSSAANNFRQTPADRRRGNKVFHFDLLARVSRLFGDEVQNSWPCTGSAPSPLSLQTWQPPCLGSSAAGCPRAANICGLPKNIHVYSTRRDLSQRLWSAELLPAVTHVQRQHARLRPSRFISP